MKSLVAAPPQLAFETRRPEPAAISLNLAHAIARLSGDSATIVTVTDAAVFYTVALQWTISSGNRRHVRVDDARLARVRSST